MRIPALDLQIGKTGQVQIPAILDKCILWEQSLKVSGETDADHEQKRHTQSQWKPLVLHQGWAKQGETLDSSAAAKVIFAKQGIWTTWTVF